MATAAAQRVAPLDVRTFRAYGSGKKENHDDLALCASRFCKLLARSLAGLCAVPPNFSVERIAVPETGEVPAAEGEGVQAILQQADADAGKRVRVSLDKPLVFSLCELVLGGLGGERPYAEQRPLSNIERNIGRRFIAVIGETLPQLFPPGSLTPLSIWMPKSESDDEAPKVSPAISITLLATFMSYSGEIQIELPQDIVSLMKLAAAAAAPGGNTERVATGWEADIAAGLEPAEVVMRAILASFQMTLEDIGKLLPGQLIRLPTSFSRPVELESDGVCLAKARLGQQAGRFCLSVLTPDGKKA